MSQDKMNTVLDQVSTLFSATQEILESWQQESNMQFPTLMGMLASRFSWDEKGIKDHDPVVRFYVRTHPDWCVTRGAHGGIMRAANKQKKQAAASAKEALKIVMKQKLETQAASMQSSQDSDFSSEDSSEEEEF